MNKIILGLCSFTSLIGFGMTVYVSLKTKSIDKRIKEIKDTQSFNRQRKQYIDSIKAYQTSLYVDKTDVFKIKMDILNDINIIYNAYKDIFSVLQKITFWRIMRQLGKDKDIDVNCVCKLMSKIIAYLSKKKED